jgi:hypothetical protein
MKATDLLKKQHKEVKALFKKVEGTENARQRGGNLLPGDSRSAFCRRASEAA